MLSVPAWRGQSELELIPSNSNPQIISRSRLDLTMGKHADDSYQINTFLFRKLSFGSRTRITTVRASLPTYDCLRQVCQRSQSR